MQDRILISPSLLAAKHDTAKDTGRAVKVAEEGGADLLHIDVMDGQLVEQRTPWNDANRIRALKTRLPLDVHLMIADPDERFLEFVHAGASMLSFHVEAAKDPEVLLSKLHQWGVKAGVAINPQTPLEKVLPYLPLIDYVLVMSVHPGKAGQRFIPSVLEKIVTIRQEYPGLPVQVDGGINQDTLPLVVAAGARIIVAGAAIYADADPPSSIGTLRETAQKSF